jgi:putative ABC transport system permease protein
MLLWIVLKVSIKSLLANKLRSVLAMLGIIIGVSAVISMLSLGAGAKAQVMSRITAMGTNLLVVRPGGQRRGGVRSGSRQSLVLKDAQSILDAVDEIKSLSPVARGRAQVKYFNENLNTTVTGASLTYFHIRNFEISKGRIFTFLEEEGGHRVAVLGAEVASQLFPDSDPVGEKVRIKAVNFTVVGVLKSKGDQGWFNPDDMVVIPYLTAMKRVLGKQHLDEINLKVNPDANTEEVEQKITKVLRQRHKIEPGSEDDFHVRNQAEFIEMATSFTKIFSVLLAGIASISLLVGGIGIMNIMLVTVTERTREIGVRKALGARERDILRQFLLESVIISSVGGALGVTLGFLFSILISTFSEYQTQVEPYSIFLSLGVATTVGVFFGYWPARKAAQLDPIEALRYE